MTMRVYRVNREGTVVEDRGTVSVRHGRQPAPDTPLPPCTCRRCRGSRSAPSEGAALGTVSMRVAATWLLDQPTPMGRETVKLFAEDFRRFLWLLIPRVERLASGRPKDDVPAQVALAGVGEARRRLAALDDTGRLDEITRVKLLARSVLGLCDHFDVFTGITVCLVCDRPIDHSQGWVPYDSLSPVISSGPGRVHARCTSPEHRR
ncbi:DUF6415 family natural product biosynthesis protein [Streptomyces sp. NPDC001980]|uniref:DUF6415 family natural product biosynthesis protein n=1 Tax=Streptomyces sp. NPDC001980 TaxID=3157126 RepID=UPI00331A5869